MHSLQVQRSVFSGSHFAFSFALLLGLALVFLVGGCGSGGKTVIQGRVISGPVGQSVSASPDDVRFDDPGIPEISVMVLGTGGTSRHRQVFSKAVSDDWGNFKLIFPGGQYPRDAIQIRVSGEGIFTSKSTSFLPPDGDRMLCVVITRPGFVIPEPPEGSEKNKK